MINVVQVSDCIDLEKRAPVMAKNKSGGSGAQRHSGRDEGRERELLAPWGAHLHPPVLNAFGVMLCTAVSVCTDRSYRVSISSIYDPCS